LPKLVALTHPYQATPAVAAAEAELSAAEVEEGISLGLVVVCPSVCLADHSCVEVGAGIREDNCLVVELGKLVAVVVEFALEGAGKLLRRLSQALQLRQDP
jgi:hypothetical protein